MFKGAVVVIVSTWAMGLAGPARAENVALSVSIAAGPVPAGLKILESQTGIELLYDAALVAGLQSPIVQGNLTPEAALRELLATTDLAIRRTSSGAWIIERPTTAPLAQQDAAVAEILVVGRRTQNVDIRRFENDVQPYTVVTRAQLVRAHRDNIDQFFNSRITSNTQVIPAGWSGSGFTISQIDLRGLGALDTLVLVDGRRMPSIPDGSSGFQQADVNGIPLHAIDRIEVLTGTAGGIYGSGALGGVVNVVLDRETRGLDLFVSGGVSSRGDAGSRAVEASYGFTSDDDRTRLTAFASWSETDPLLVGERGYASRDRRLTAELAPDVYADLGITGDSVAVIGIGSTLEFKPEFGGGVIASNRTFLPSGFSGTPAELAAVLSEHAGQLDFSLSESDATRDLGVNPRINSWLFNLRHRFDAGLEVYADAMVSNSHGQSTDRSTGGTGILFAESPANPFTSPISVIFPIPLIEQRANTRVETSRYTAGLLAELPFDWRGTIEAGHGATGFDLSLSLQLPTSVFLFLTGDPSDLDTNPLGDWNAFQAAMIGNPGRGFGSMSQKNRFQDYSLRVAGPLFTTAAGPSTLTFLAESRKEHVRPADASSRVEVGGTTVEFTDRLPGRLSATRSLYAELRAPLLASDARFHFLRGLDLQLAARRDDQRNEFVEDPTADDADVIRLRPEFVSTSYTLGAKITPWPWLMLRTSYATGEQPPPPAALREISDELTDSPITTDPKRGDQYLGEEGPFLWRSGGKHDLKTAQANTFFLGAVLSPSGVDGPTFAVDYSRIRKTRDVLSLFPVDVMAHEDAWPERVTRAPLSDADRALGYTAGPVTMIDTRRMNGAGKDVDAFDARTDWPLSFLGGRLRLYANATYHKNNRSTALFQPSFQSAGYLGGPLTWRANGGFDWSTERLTVGTNLQYFGRYRMYLNRNDAPAADDLVRAQGSLQVPAQRYLDAQASWRLPVHAKTGIDEVTLDLGVINVLDAAPPRETSLNFGDPGISLYGDPRRRRFELAMSVRL